MSLPADFTAAQTAMAASALASGSDRKALVVLYLGGGIDAHNFISPRTGANRTAYEAARSSVSIADNAATALSSALQFHPSCTELKTMYDAGMLAVVPNIGPLVAPITKAEYQVGSVETPVQLFSHSDQNTLWQTGTGYPTSTEGWLGRLADLIHPSFNPASNPAMGITYAGPQTSHRSYEERVLGMKSTGMPARDGSSRINAGIRAAFATEMAETYTHPMMAELAAAQLRSASLTTEVTSAIGGVTIGTSFPSGTLGTTLQTAAKVIGAQSTLAQRRTTLWVTDGGYDHHADLLTSLTAKLDNLSPSISAFWDAMIELGREDDVVMLVYSEFGRSLTQNGSGTDHAWGGHALVIGGGVTGGVQGTFPDLSLAGSNMVDARGYLIPAIATDSLYATLANWFGVPDATADGVNPMNLLLPNLSAFGSRNLGFLP